MLIFSLEAFSKKMFDKFEITCRSKVPASTSVEPKKMVNELITDGISDKFVGLEV